MAEDSELGRYRTRAAVLGGRSRVPGPRTEVAASWRRVAACGVDPGGGPGITPLSEADLARRRSTSGLASFLPRLGAALEPVLDAGQLMVVTDADGRVLWRRGCSGVRRMADRLGFVSGSAWTEGNVGTNAIGTALVLGTPVHIRGAEHFVESHTQWGCAASPITDPWTGRTLGVVDVSGPSRSLHPAELAAVSMAARLAGLELVEERRQALDRLRVRAAPLVARLTGRALVVDEDGHTALATDLEAPDVVTLPTGMGVGQVWLPTLGPAAAEAVPGGWLLRLGGDHDEATALVLDLTGTPTVRVTGAVGAWTHRLTPRRAELMVALVQAGLEGRSAAQLAADVFGDPTRVVTVRAEMSRLRRGLGGLLLGQPYRIAPSVTVGLELPADPDAVLPTSGAPAVVALRSRPREQPAR